MIALPLVLAAWVGTGAAPELLRLAVPGQEPFAGDPPLVLQVAGTDGAPLAAKLSVRACGAVATVGEGGVLTLTLGDDKAPRVVVVVVSDGVHHGAAFLPVASRRPLQVKATRGTMVEVRVGTRVFGPWPAGTGSLEVPVEIRAPDQVGTLVATDPGGNERKETLDLRTPKRPRLAALLSGTVAAGEAGAIIVAAADASGSPGSVPPVAEALRGKVGAAVALGPGLWLLPYAAPRSLGADEVMVRLPQDAGAGEDAVPVDVVLGAPASLEVAMPPGKVLPGSRMRLTVLARDRGGNPTPTPAMQVTIESASPRPWDGQGDLEVELPPVLPPGATAHLSLVAGTLAATAEIAMQPGPATSAALEVDTGRRDARVRVIVRDGHGNILGPDRVALRLTGAAAAAPLTPAGPELETTVLAADEARRAEVVVVADDRVLQQLGVDFAPPPSAWLIGASATAGFSYNGGRMWAPGAAVGIETSFGLGPVQLGAALRVGYYYASGQSEPVALGGVNRTVTWELNAVPVSLPLRLRLPLGDRFGISAAGGPVLTWVQTKVDADLLPSRHRQTIRFGGFGELAGDIALGPGRLVLAARLGSTQADTAEVVGELDGLSLQLGYVWYFWDVGAP